MSDTVWVPPVWCVVPWCFALARRARPDTDLELKGLCSRCATRVRALADGVGVPMARRQWDGRHAVRPVGLGTCDGCRAPAVVLDGDGGAWCAAHATQAITVPASPGVLG